MLLALLSERDAERARAEKAEAERDDLLARSVLAQDSHSITLAERDQACADLEAAKAEINNMQNTINNYIHGDEDESF